MLRLSQSDEMFGVDAELVEAEMVDRITRWSLTMGSLIEIAVSVNQARSFGIGHTAMTATSDATLPNPTSSFFVYLVP